jgi:hypothetical protein
MDLELNEIRARMEKLAFKMQQDAKAHWVYEWPMKKKVKWPVRNCWPEDNKLLKRWLRHVENLSDTEEELIHICEPETGRNLSDEEEKRSDEDLINCQVGGNGLSSFQVGNGKRPGGGLVYCQRSSVVSSDFQVGNEMGLIDLIDCQVGSREFPNFQVGREKEMRLSESLWSSEVSSCQQGVMIGEDSCGFVDHVNEYDEKLNTLTIQEEDQRSIMIIGGIQIFLPDSPVEARACVADETIEEGQPAMTVMMKERYQKFPKEKRKKWRRH